MYLLIALIEKLRKAEKWFWKIILERSEKNTVNADHTAAKGYHFEPLAEANLSNNFLFVKVMSDPEILKPFLEMVLKIKIKKLKMTEYEKTLIPDMYAKGIRMDVYADDGKNAGEGTLYNVEMQQRNEYNISKRSRYYQSAMDIDALAKGEDYDRLKNTYIIFVCLFDPFGRERQRYTFVKTCMEENDIRLDDGSVVLVLTDNPGEPEIEKFYRYLKNSTDEEAESSESEFIKQLNRQVQKVRYDRKTEVEYLNFERLQKEQYNIGRKDGYLEGKQTGYIEGEKKGEQKGELKKEKFLAERMKAKGMNDDELAELLEITPERLREILSAEAEKL